MTALLPRLYQRWLAQLLGEDPPVEHRIDCDDCSMARRPDVERLEEELDFRPDLKCCTYYPGLVNFKVGDILGDPSCLGAAVVRERIAHGWRVSPLGIACPPLHDAVTREQSTDLFGHSERLRCAFLSSRARCNIWPHREATCATYHCKFDRGQRGERYWTELQRLLFGVEQQLALHCALHLDLGTAATNLSMHPDASDLFDRWRDREAMAPALRRSLWGKWAGRETQFFVAASKLTEHLDWPTVAEICGPTIRAQSDELLRSHRALADALPRGALVAGRFTATRTGPTRRLLGYSCRDVMELPAPAVDQLARFDGRPTDQVLSETPAIDRQLLRRLVDFGILVAQPGGHDDPD